MTATVATIGLNPSRQEFLDRKGDKLREEFRRFETMESLGVTSLAAAEESTLRRVVDGCNNYFHRSPYRRWFDQLEPVLQAVDASYYRDTACHLDLVQWATDPVWGRLPPPDRKCMLSEDIAVLKHQLDSARFRLVFLNGRGVLTEFERAIGIRLEKAGMVTGGSSKSNLFVGQYSTHTKIVAWSVNIQSSFGVCGKVRKELTTAIAELSN